MAPSWITAMLWQRGLHNSVKLWAMPCKATQDGQVIVESSEKMWSTKGGNGKPLQYSCCKNPMNCQIRSDQSLSHVWLFATPWIAARQASKRYDTGKWAPRSKVSSMLLGKSRGQLLITLERRKRLSQSRNDAQLWTFLVVKVKFSAEKNNLA